ncbi:hypothetical protein AB0C70_23000 [Streptomyces sp. NPDC048564]|uniref:hypothetical protein n=1 Tax=Streptomyces sp. NPDC048564 TaxID=3155760 RepID=UPI003431DD84
MDAGLAAVLGALAGAVATTGAAFATGWSAREQAKITARAEHRRQRRDARQAVYEELINAVEMLIEATRSVDLGVTASRANQEQSYFIPDMKEVKSLEKSVRKIATKVTLAGPASISEMVEELRGIARSLAANLIRIEMGIEFPGIPEHKEGWLLAEADRVALYRAVAEFAAGAQAILDDDGTRGSP